MRKRLLAIYGDLERRARATTDAHPAWPCRRGCDHCCRTLAELPRFTRAEWDLLREGVLALPAPVRADVDARVSGLSAETTSPITCPLLDAAEGACLVYAHRPAACRTYGFYVRRRDGLHCDLVTRFADAEGREVVWGNHEAVDDALVRLSGDEALLTTWWEREPPR